MISERQTSSFAGHAATYAIGNIARRLVGFIMLPIYTRYLTPADYGVVGLLTIALSFLEPLLGARLAEAVPKFYFAATEEHTKSSVIWNALFVTGSVSALTTIAIVLFRGPESQILFGSREYAFATGFFAINMVSQPVEYTGMMYLRLQERSRLFLGVSMAKMVLQVVLNLLLVVYWQLSVLGVVLSGVVSSVATCIALMIYIGSHTRPTLDKKITRAMLRFCWPLWFSGLAGLYTGSSGSLYLRLFDSLSDVGLLGLGMKFATVVGLIVWAPFFQHWEPMSYRYHREGSGRDKFQVAFLTISLLMFVCGLGISIFAEPVIRVMATPGFRAAAGVVPILTLGLILNSIVSFFYFSFFIADRTKLDSLSRYITVVVITVFYLALIPTLGLVGAAVGQCLAFALNFVYVYFWSKKYFDPGFQLAPIGLLVLISALAYTCSNVIFGNHNPAVDLLTKSITLVIASGLMSLVAVRAIRKSSPSAYDRLQSSLRRFGLGGLMGGSARE